MVRSAALASIVEPSTPIRSPFTRPRSATTFKTQPKTCSCHLVRQSAARLRQPGMVRNLVPVRKPKEIPQRIGIRTAPDDAALAVDPLEIADHVHAEIAARRQ